MAFLFCLLPPDKNNQDPTEYAGIVYTNDPDEVTKRVEAAMPQQLKDLGYKVWMNNMGDPLPEFCFIVEKNTPISLDRFSEDRFVREFLNGKTNRASEG